MKRELRRIADLFRTEIRIASSLASAVVSRRNALAAGSLALLLIAGKGIAEAQRLSLSPSSFLLRGRRAAAFVPAAAKPLRERPKKRHPLLLIDAIGSKIQSETVKHWNGIHRQIAGEWDKLIGHEWDKLIGREWDKLASSVVKLFSDSEVRHEGSEKLDEVIRTFSSVLNGNDVNTAQLLRACRAHLLLMKTGGASMRVVARDMEANLDKAESLFKKLPKQVGGRLATLLERERESGIHDGSVLKDDSAAMGLLWIRRSLAFQLDLYSSLIPSDGQHPKDAAMDAYYKTLSPYHGWLLQKAFPLSLSQMPRREAFIAYFGGREIEEFDAELEGVIVKKLERLVATWEPIIRTWEDEFRRLDLEDTRRA
mmetsp:Transcript_21446/g.45837  ORF Transcript_21446/g.45837 Transcript_21446/m.45837 type:complete len:369 (+) Transcript_21446:112-1218(+)